MNRKKKLGEDKVRVIKVGKEALFEFIYEKFIEDQDIYFDIDPSDVTDTFNMDFENGEFIFCIYNSEDKYGNFVRFHEDIDLNRLMKNIPDTTQSMFSGIRYKEFTKDELIKLSKQSLNDE